MEIIKKEIDFAADFEKTCAKIKKLEIFDGCTFHVHPGVVQNTFVLTINKEVSQGLLGGCMENWKLMPVNPDFSAHLHLSLSINKEEDENDIKLTILKPFLELRCLLKLLNVMEEVTGIQKRPAAMIILNLFGRLLFDGVFFLVLWIVNILSFIVLAPYVMIAMCFRKKKKKRRN